MKATLNTIANHALNIAGPYSIQNSLGQRYEVNGGTLTRLDDKPNPIGFSAPTRQSHFGQPIPRSLRRNACHTLR